jgi:cob(I)alamin adenosyltransferase
MSPLYTRTGDAGSTRLLGEDRLPKDHPRIEALGTLDEASAALGLARALCRAPQTEPILKEVQRDLYRFMAEFSSTPKNPDNFTPSGLTRVDWLESQADSISNLVPIPGEFILPGDSLSGAALDLARTVIRRAERQVVRLKDEDKIKYPILLQYLNRLSSLCFALELLENQSAGNGTTLAKI